MMLKVFCYCCYTQTKQNVDTNLLVEQQPKPMYLYKSSKYVIVGEFMQSNISLAFDRVNRTKVIIKKSRSIQNELNALEFSECELIEKILAYDIDKNIIVYGFNEYRDLYFYMSKSLLSVVQSCHIVLKPILQALEFIHKKGYAHRDVKPENILFYANGCKLTDFDFCEKLPECGYFSDCSGSPSFIAPEVKCGKGCLESDIWSLGIVFYECLYKRLPSTSISTCSQTFDNIMMLDTQLTMTIDSILNIMLNKDIKIRNNCYHKIYRLIDSIIR